MSFASGEIDPELSAEFPGLRLRWTALDGRVLPSSADLRRRVRLLSDRYRGAGVVAMRTQPIPHAYRAFFRQIGLDPDATRIPSEEAAVTRLLHGGFRSRDLLSDAMLIALVETGVPVWALNADLVEPGGLGIRSTVDGEAFGGAGQQLPPGRLAVVDARRVHALLFGPLAPGHAASARTPRVVLFAVGVDGVPAIHVEESLWNAADVLSSV